MRIKYYEGDDIAVISLRGPDKTGEIAGDDLLHPETGETVPGIVTHRANSTPRSSSSRPSTPGTCRISWTTPT